MWKGLESSWSGQKKPEQAVAFFRQATDIAVELGNVAKEGTRRNNIANTLRRLGRHDEARQETVLLAKDSNRWYSWIYNPPEIPNGTAEGGLGSSAAVASYGTGLAGSDGKLWFDEFDAGTGGDGLDGCRDRIGPIAHLHFELGPRIGLPARHE